VLKITWHQCRGWIGRAHEGRKKPTGRLLEHSVVRQGFLGLKHQEMQKSRWNQEILRYWSQRAFDGLTIVLEENEVSAFYPNALIHSNNTYQSIIG